MRRVRVVICVRIQRGKHRWIQRETAEMKGRERGEGGREEGEGGPDLGQESTAATTQTGTAPAVARVAPFFKFARHFVAATSI